MRRQFAGRRELRPCHLPLHSLLKWRPKQNVWEREGGGKEKRSRSTFRAHLFRAQPGDGHGSFPSYLRLGWYSATQNSGVFPRKVGGISRASVAEGGGVALSSRSVGGTEGFIHCPTENSSGPQEQRNGFIPRCVLDQLRLPSASTTKFTPFEHKRGVALGDVGRRTAAGVLTLRSTQTPLIPEIRA